MRKILGLCVLVLVVPGAAGAAVDRCLQGASAAQDAVDIAGLRRHLAAVCPCSAYNGLTPATSRGAYLRCVRPVVADASDGTPIQGTFGLRAKCRATVKRTHITSDCGSSVLRDRNPCCRHDLVTGRNSGRIKLSSSCVSTPGVDIQNNCPAAHFVADACSGDATNSCYAIETPSTLVIPSGAEPPDTPGSPGVTVTNPLLLTQFGGSSFSLNNVTYTRFRTNRPAPSLDAVLILIPGFEGGAGSFRLFAESLVSRALNEHSMAIEVWAYDRRTNQLEDLVGLDLAEGLLDPQVGLDWLFGGELLLPLHPVLVAGPNRRAVFYNATSDVPFLARWTNLVFSRDIDALVDTADAVVRNHNVFLGGHSAGTGFTARYAATDLDLTGLGPAQPGYAKVRGLVLIEGPGGATGTTLTADSLDRVEAAANGGQYYAVRDDASRCSDGTPCTIATEAVDCALTSPAKCTPRTQAYSTGLLNPRILASVEPVGIQGMTDPDTGLGILQVTQPSSLTAIGAVPDLAALAILPQSTVFGGLGSFLDDDGLIGSSVAPFVATSLGAPGPVVGGVLTWQDISEGPMPSAVLPNNNGGVQPTTLPGVRWGQEKEVTRLSRMLPVFFAGGTNFTDWYYPAAGPGTTVALGACPTNDGLDPRCAGVCAGGLCTAGNIGAACTSSSQCAQAVDLDSSALSVGRGRRDIENLTQATAINVPVIAFGATNGLLPVPGRFTAFATSIGTCTAPGCDGTPRVINASVPNPAFPTFGGVAGGFEVHMTVGFAHVDVVTADDGPDNNVLGPLGAFLARNVQ
jgi:pimeloyl-ACP methyl ester carboxylesterase